MQAVSISSTHTHMMAYYQYDALNEHYNTPRQFLLFQTKVSTCKLSEATKHSKEGFLLGV